MIISVDQILHDYIRENIKIDYDQYKTKHNRHRALTDDERDDIFSKVKTNLVKSILRTVIYIDFDNLVIREDM